MILHTPPFLQSTLSMRAAVRLLHLPLCCACPVASLQLQGYEIELGTAHNAVGMSGHASVSLSGCKHGEARLKKADIVRFLTHETVKTQHKFNNTPRDTTRDPCSVIQVDLSDPVTMGVGGSGGEERQHYDRELLRLYDERVKADQPAGRPPYRCPHTDQTHAANCSLGFRFDES